MGACNNLQVLQMQPNLIAKTSNKIGTIIYSLQMEIS